MAIHVDQTLYHGRPADTTDRLEKELRCYDLLDRLGIQYDRADHEHADTIPDCELVENVLGAEICKNLFLTNRQETVFYLLLMPGTKPFKTKDLSKQIGSSRLSFAGADHMLRLGIGALLSYCKRFFERQFEEGSTRKSDFKAQLDLLLDNYLSSGSSSQQGQPTVAWCAGRFYLSPNYFGDLVRRELHVTAQDYIQQKLVTKACQLLTTTPMTVAEIAEELGFSYPTHFARMFRRKTGLSPQQYRQGLHCCAP